MVNHPVTSENARSSAIGCWSALLPLSIFVAAAPLVPTTVSGERLLLVLDWIPSLGVSLSPAVDGLSLLFVLIISLAGILLLGHIAGSYSITDLIAQADVIRSHRLTCRCWAAPVWMQTPGDHRRHYGIMGRLMPITAASTAAAALSMAGFPLFFGFIGKEIMYKGALAEALFPQFSTAAALVSNALMTSVAGILFSSGL